MSFFRALVRRGDHARARELLVAAIREARGNLVRAAHDLGLPFQGTRKHLDRYDLHAVVAEARKRAGAPPAWLVRTLAVVEGGVVEKLQGLYQAAAGMAVEDVQAEVEASSRAGQVDAAALAEAIVAGAAAMSDGAPPAGG